MFNKNQFKFLPLVFLAIFFVSFLIFTGDDEGIEPKIEAKSKPSLPIESKDLNETEKKLFKDFYREIISKTNQADISYNEWNDKVQGTSDPMEAYLAGNEIKSTLEQTSLEIKKINTPEINLSNDENDRLKKAINSFSLAYDKKSQAIEKLQLFLSSNQKSFLSEAKELLDSYDSLILTGSATLVEIMINNDIDPNL